MALLRCDFFSEALEPEHLDDGVLPQQTTAQIGMAGRAADGPPPVLYLLHGLSDDDTIWLRRTSIERYVAAARARRGDAAGAPQLLHRRGVRRPVLDLPLRGAPAGRRHASSGSPTAREDTFVAGLSMGGYGALKWALRQPERFAAAASLSGALDLAAAVGPAAGGPRHVGARLRRPAPPAAARTTCSRCSAGRRRPRCRALHVSCGTEDALVEGNRRFVATPARSRHPVTTSFGPGEHEWGYWDARIQDVLAWLPLAQR